MAIRASFNGLCQCGADALLFRANLKPVGNSGCVVYADLNADETLNSGEPWATTSAAGRFNLTLTNLTAAQVLLLIISLYNWPRCV